MSCLKELSKSFAKLHKASTDTLHSTMEYLNVHDESFSRPQSSAANSWRGSYASSSGESYTEIQLLPISSGRSDDHRSSEDSHGESHSSSSDTGTEHHHIEPIVKDKERVPEGEAQDHEEHHHECECGHDHDGDDEHDNDHDHDHIDKEDELQEVPTGFFGKIEKFWCNNVTIIVPGATARDHLGKSKKVSVDSRSRCMPHGLALISRLASPASPDFHALHRRWMLREIRHAALHLPPIDASSLSSVRTFHSDTPVMH